MRNFKIECNGEYNFKERNIEPQITITNNIVRIMLYICAWNLILNEIAPSVIPWIRYLPFIKYTYAVSVQNEFDGLSFLLACVKVVNSLMLKSAR